MNFDAAFQHVLKHEGLFSDHPADKGGATMYGITEAVARRVGYRGDMRDLPVELASNTSLKIVVRGTDGVTRSVSLTLA